MTKKYYKICYLSGNTLMSYADGKLYNIDKNLPITYKLDQWNYPNFKDTKLMVFDSLENAQNWLSQDSVFPNRNNKIFECEVKNPTKRSIFLRIVFADYTCINKTLKMCITLKNKKKKYSQLCYQPPKGTVFVSALKLIKEVKI